jgi:hypothetical protein
MLDYSTKTKQVGLAILYHPSIILTMKTQRIALAIVHGIGKQEPDFAIPVSNKIRAYFAKKIEKYSKDPKEQIVIKSVHWAPALQRSEDILRLRLKKGGPLDYTGLRDFMVNFAADAIAYQPTGSSIQTYTEVHRIFAETLSYLALETGSRAPLAIVSHSLGTVISSNYIYDLQNDEQKKLVPMSVKAIMTGSELEKGDTFARFFTLGSPIALWSLRYGDFGSPIKVPSSLCREHYPKLSGEWLNFYDEDDVIGYPLKTLNEYYAKAVTKDRAVNVGGLFSFWNPLSHSHYWNDGKVLGEIADSLADMWKKANGI